MRHFALLCCAVVLVGCKKSQQAATATGETKAAPPAATPAPPPLAITDLTGKWNVVVMPEGKDTTLLTYVLDASGDTSKWVIVFPKQKPVPIHIVALAGDSVVTEAGPYRSVLRKGMMVRTRAVSRVQNGQMVGTTVAHYKTTKADSVLTLRTSGTKAP
ncbi:MAG TPA: hypothetical protein VFQ38_15615 [Longimicrobiales bacterium]|nr:hypothetical protein [Longimicrobiales bacterium]